jgi:hypothetical protein
MLSGKLQNGIGVISSQTQQQSGKLVDCNWHEKECLVFCCSILSRKSNKQVDIDQADVILVVVCYLGLQMRAEIPNFIPFSLYLWSNQTSQPPLRPMAMLVENATPCLGYLYLPECSFSLVVIG